MLYTYPRIVCMFQGEQVGEGDNIASQLIATNDLLSPLYQRTRRYVPSVVQVGDVYMYIMHVYSKSCSHTTIGGYGEVVLGLCSSNHVMYSDSVSNLEVSSN